MPAASIIAAPTPDVVSARPANGHGRPAGDADLFAGLLETAPAEATPAASTPTSTLIDGAVATEVAPPSDDEAVDAAKDVDTDSSATQVQAQLIAAAPPPPTQPVVTAEGAPGKATAPSAPVEPIPTPAPNQAAAPAPAPAPIPAAAQAVAAAAATLPPPLRAQPGAPAGQQAALDETGAEPASDEAAPTAAKAAEGLLPAKHFMAGAAPAPAPVAGAAAALQQSRSALLSDGVAAHEGAAGQTSTDKAAPAGASASASSAGVQTATSAAAPATPQAAPPAAAATAALVETASAPTGQVTPPSPPAEQSAPAIAAHVTSGLSHAALETTAQLSAQIIRKLEGRQTRFDMVLTPDDLGRVDVSLDIDSDGRLAARLAFDNPAAAAELRGRADELRRQLQDAGFQIAGDGLDFAERDGGASRGGSGEREAPPAFARAARLSAAADAASQSASPVWRSLSLTPDSVDVRV